MKIMLCCRVYATHGRPGGMIHVVTDRAETLSKMGHDVHVVTSKTISPSFQIQDGVHVHHASLGTPMEYSDEYAESCQVMYKKLRPDILHLDSYDKNRLWWHGLKASVTNHGEAIGSQLTTWRMHHEKFNQEEWLDEQFALSKAHRVIATCRFDRWLLSDLLDLKDVCLIYNPIAQYFYNQERYINKRTDALLFVGIWGHKERGFDTAKEAAKKLGVEFLVPRNVLRSELVAYYDCCHALVLPGWHSCGFDLCIAEALARGRPVIMGDCGIATMEDTNGIIPVRAGDSDAVVKAVNNLPTISSYSRHQPMYHCEKWLEAVQ